MIDQHRNTVIEERSDEMRAEMIKEGRKEYLETVKRLNRAYQKYSDIDDVELFFTNNLIKCVKYNHSIGSPQKQRCNDSLLQMNSEGTRLMIIKKEVKERVKQITNKDQDFSRNIDK